MRKEEEKRVESLAGHLQSVKAWRKKENNQEEKTKFWKPATCTVDPQ